MAANLRPTNRLSIDANATFTNAKLTQDLPVIADATYLAGSRGDRLPFTPKFAANLGARQTFPISGTIDGFVSGNISYVGSRKSEFRNIAASDLRQYNIPAYTSVDVLAGLNVTGSWHATAYVRNLLNGHGVISTTDHNGTSNRTANFLTPRTIGATLAKDF